MGAKRAGSFSELGGRVTAIMTSLLKFSRRHRAGGNDIGIEYDGG